MDKQLGHLATSPRDGSEPLHRDGRPIGRTVLDFWRWSSSDLSSDATRKLFAQFLVGTALGVDLDSPRDESMRFGLRTPAGTRIEVTSKGLLDFSNPATLRNVTFGMPLTALLDSASDVLNTSDTSRAEVCVFAFLSHKDKATLDPLDAAQWRFWVVSSAALHERARGWITTGVAALERVAGASVRYEELAEAVGAAAVSP